MDKTHYLFGSSFPFNVHMWVITGLSTLHKAFGMVCYFSLGWLFMVIPGLGSAVEVIDTSSWVYKNVKSIGEISGTSYDLKIRDNHYYNIEDGELVVSDFSDPVHPVRLSHTPILVHNISSLAIYKDIAMIAGWGVEGAGDDYGVGWGLTFYDISNPKLPTIINAMELGLNEIPSNKIVIDGSWAYMLCELYSTQNTNVIRKLDLDHIGYSMEVAYESIRPEWGSNIYDFAANGNWAYALTEKGLITLDISTSVSLDQKAFIPIASPPPNGMVVNGNFAYISCANSSGSDSDGISLRIYDLSNPLAPVLVGQQITRGSVTDIAYTGGMICLAYGDYGTAILRLIDVSNPAKPQILGEVLTSKGENGFDAAMYNGLIFLYNQCMRYTPPQTVEISGLTRSGYRADYLRPRNLVYTDRPYEYTAPLPYQGFKEQSYIQTRHDDKHSTGSSFLRFSIDRPATVYVAYDERASAPPRWLAGWVKKSLRLASDDRLSPGRILYARDFPAGEVVLGGNRDAAVPAPADLEMYGVLVVPRKAGAGDWTGYE